MSKTPVRGSQPEPEVSKDTISRRAWLGGAAMLVGAGACLASTSASAKTSQQIAKYQADPKGSSKCGVCAQFQAPTRANSWRGRSVKTAWCQLFTPKAG